MKWGSMSKRLSESDLDHLLDKIEDAYVADDLPAMKRLVAQAARMFPDDLSVKEWQAAAAADEERFEEALSILNGILLLEPDRYFAQREQTSALFELGHFQEALASIEKLEARLPEDLEREER